MLSVVFLEEVSVEAAGVAKMKPESKALRWGSIYLCEVRFCCGMAQGRLFSCSPRPCGGYCVGPLPMTAWASCYREGGKSPYHKPGAGFGSTPPF